VRSRVLTAAGAILLMAGAALAQYGGPRGPFRLYPNIPYDGRFTFVRLKYTHGPGGNWYGGWPSWAHGYPLSEQNLMRIMQEVSYINPHVDDINAITLDDPALFHYPLAYIIEVDWWAMSDREAVALRAYLQKGGFVIVDDFKPRRGGRFGRFGGGLGGDLGGDYGTGWDVFEAAMKRVMPDGKFVDLDASHPIFHSFFEVNNFDIIPQAYIAGRPSFRGLFEDNDPAKRLQIMVNYNTDVSQFWEWSGTGLRPIDETNEAYKLGVNYIIYGLTH
jgi:hypothetical protein